MGKRTYSDTEKATALAMLDANGGNLSRTQREVGVPRTTLREWRDGRHNGQVADIRQEKKEHLADLFEAFIRNVLPVAEGKMKGASFRDLLTGVGIAADKLLALRGEAPAEDQKQKVNVFIKNHLGSGELPEF